MALFKKAKFKPPVSDRVSCEFGVNGSQWICGHHTGVDYASKTGTDVHAVADGVIVAVNWGPAYGLHVVVQHYSYRYIYAHLDSKAHIKPGTSIKQGMILGKSGQTGSAKAGPHLHLEARAHPYRYAVDAVDPRTCLK